MEPEVPERKRRDCWICFNNEINITLTKLNWDKMLNCKTYLETSIIITSFENEIQVTCCDYCYESANQLQLLEEQVKNLQKEISDLSSLFSKNVLERRSRFKNEISKSAEKSNRATNKPLLINKNYSGHAISIIENVSVKQEVVESKEFPSDSSGQTEGNDLVTDMRLDEDKYEIAHNDKCENFIHSEEAIDIKYSYDETVPEVVNTVNKQVVQYQMLPSTNAHLDQQAKTISTEELLKSVKMPVILLKRLQYQPSGSPRSPNNVSDARKEDMKCENGFIQPKTYSEKLSKGKRFKCHEISCSKWFKSALHLNRHEKVHSEEKPFKCSLCSKTFKHSSNLSVHKKVHSEEKPHSCCFCEKSFKWLGDLKVHERIHSGERPYKCLHCSMAFSVKSSLKRHGVIHSTVRERRHKCSFCAKSFYKSGDAKRHEEIHIGKRRNKCSICEKTFTLSQHLKKHRERKHGETKEEFILP